jgi:hypothetical protein
LAKPLNALLQEGAKTLEKMWSQVEKAVQENGTLDDFLDNRALREAIARSINSDTKTYRYVLPTQILAKLVDINLDSHSLQAGQGKERAFDARSICSKVIVPFDHNHENVLGGSGDPYVNNPLRGPELSAKYAADKKDKNGWNDLCLVVDAIEANPSPDFHTKVFLQILVEIYRRMGIITVTYPVPRRTSLLQCLTLADKFLEEVSGGDRLLALCSALFITIGKSFGLWNDVRRAKINAADSASGAVADLECINLNDEIVMAVEVKDRCLTINQVKEKLINLRAENVTEILFLAQDGVQKNDQLDTKALIEREYNSGHNIYVFSFPEFASSSLALIGEEGRRNFLHTVGEELDRYSSDLKHRQAWAALLQNV